MEKFQFNEYRHIIFLKKELPVGDHTNLKSSIKTMLLANTNIPFKMAKDINRIVVEADEYGHLGYTFYTRCNDSGLLDTDKNLPRMGDFERRYIKECLHDKREEVVLQSLVHFIFILTAGQYGFRPYKEDEELVLQFLKEYEQKEKMYFERKKTLLKNQYTI